MNKILGSRASEAGRPTVAPELPRPPAGTVAQPVLKRSSAMPELQAKRGAVLAPALSQHGNRRSMGEEEDSALRLFRQTHERMMSRVTQDLASAGKEGQKAAPDAVKNVVKK